MENKRVGLKVTGIMLGIIAGITALALIFSVTLLPVMKYNTAIKNAGIGNYELAVKGLYELDYKDSEKLLQEYALSAAKQALSTEGSEAAQAYLSIAISSGDNAEIANEAKDLYEKNFK